jgi:hypothetical protein
MRHRRLIPAFVVGLLATATLTGCAGPIGESHTCVDWVFFDSPAGAVDAADAVIAGTIVGQSGSTQMFGEQAPIWTVEVADWIKGDGDDELEVVSTPATCEATTPADPVEVHQDDARVIVFLHDDPDVGWRTMTPFHGITPAGADGGVPEVWQSEQTGE